MPTPGGIQFWLQADPNAPHGDRCEVLPLPRKEWSFGFEPRAIVALHVSADIGEVRQQQLRDLLGLTQAEAEIAILAANGSSREEIARTRGATANTVGSQLKSIFAKADVTREAELVALVNRLLR
jgi:DNA-binding CsgD family transcriptional regulator